MRLLFLNWRDPVNPLAGGAEAHIWQLGAHLAEAGYRFSAICCGFPGAAPRERVGAIEVHRCGSEKTYPVFLPACALRVAEEFRPDVVIEFLNKLPLYSPCYLKQPVICFVHHLFGSAADLEARLWLATVLRTAERFIPKFYPRVHFAAGSASTLKELSALGIPLERLRLLPYGFNTENYTTGEKDPAPTLLYLGRIKRYKGIEDLLSIMPRLLKRFPALKAIIAGSGDHGEQLQRDIQSLSLAENVRYMGHVSEAQKLALYQQAWGMFLLSAKEGFGLTVGEAGLCGTPTVAYDVPGLRDSIVNGTTGVLVPFKSTEDLYTAFENLLRNTDERIRLGNAARTHFLAHDWKHIAPEWHEMLVGVTSWKQSLYL